jgi:hypothetical protein
MNRIKITDTTTNAWKANREDALRGFDLEAAQREIAQKVADFLTDQQNARGIAADDDGEKFVPMMRELGGFPKVVAMFLPTEVEASPSGHGVPVNPEWFRRESLVGTVGQIANYAREILRLRAGDGVGFGARVRFTRKRSQYEGRDGVILDRKDSMFTIAFPTHHGTNFGHLTTLALRRDFEVIK